MDQQSLKSLQIATGHFGQGRLPEAEELCRSIVAAFPKAVDALHLLALIRRRSGETGDARELFSSCLELAPRRADIRANFGHLLAAQGSLHDAIEAYRQALQHDATFRPARLALARQLNASEQFEQALAESQKLIDANKSDAEAWVAQGIALRGLNRTDDAESAYRAAIGLKKNYAIAHHNLGALLAQTSRSEEALVELDKSVELGLRGPVLAFNRASALMSMYEFDAAERLLVEAIEDSPGALDPLRLLARLRFMRGAENFVQEFEAGIAAAPDNVALKIALGQILNSAGRLDDAKAILHAAREQSPHNAFVLAELASVHQESGDFEQALENARAASATAPDAVEPQNRVIDALLSLGEAQEAMPLIESLRRRYPLNQWYIAMEASAARLLNDPLYEFLYDYDQFVQPFEVEAPSGWTSMQSFQDDLTAALIERHKFHAQPLDQSLRSGTQTPRGLLGDPDPVIQSFIKALADPIEQYREIIGVDDSHPMRSRNHGNARMTGCWSVRLSSGGYHVNHVHPEGWMSSAYYVSVPNEVKDTEARSGWIKFGEPRFPVPGATAEKYVQPHAGMLVLFPSYMWHGTMPIHGDEPRMTVAFDAVTET